MNSEGVEMRNLHSSASHQQVVPSPLAARFSNPDFKDWLARTRGALVGVKIKVAGVEDGRPVTVVRDARMPRVHALFGTGPSTEHIIQNSGGREEAVTLKTSTRTGGREWAVARENNSPHRQHLEDQYKEFAEIRGRGSYKFIPYASVVVGGKKRRTRRRRRGRHGKRARKTGRKASKTRGRRRRGRSTRGRRRR